MAKDVTSQPWVFDAEDQFEGVANEGESTPPNFNVPVFIHRLRIDTGAGGDILINQSDGGKRLVKLDGTPADDTIPVELNQYFDGIFTQTLPANASVEVFHGMPFNE